MKTETLFWKSFKNHLGKDYLVDRIESYATPGFPDCLIFHQKTGFFTVELKVVKGNDKVTISPLQISWNFKHFQQNPINYYLVKDPRRKIIELYDGDQGRELLKKGGEAVPKLTFSPQHYQKLLEVIF